MIQGYEASSRPTKERIGCPIDCKESHQQTSSMCMQNDALYFFFFFSNWLLLSLTLWLPDMLFPGTGPGLVYNINTEPKVSKCMCQGRWCDVLQDLFYAMGERGGGVSWVLCLEWPFWFNDLYGQEGLRSVELELWRKPHKCAVASSLTKRDSYIVRLWWWRWWWRCLWQKGSVSSQSNMTWSLVYRHHPQQHSWCSQGQKRLSPALGQKWME